MASSNKVLPRRPKAKLPERKGAPSADPRTTVSLLTSLPEIERVIPEWRRLFVDSGCSNPWLVPEWQLEWAARFTQEGELRFIAVRERDRLIALAPFYRRAVRIGGVRVLTRTRLLGSGPDTGIAELSQVLCDPGSQRKALREVFAFLAEHPEQSDWIDISLSPEQGWFESEWLPATSDKASEWISPSVGSHASVVLDLPDEVGTLDSFLKPNMRNNIRKSKNRLARAGIEWTVQVADTPGPRFDSALSELVDLHSTRARVSRGLGHDDYLEDPRQVEFLRAVAPKMAAAGYLSIWSLATDSGTLASLLVLHANGHVHFSVSGMNPDFWNFRPMTLLRSECIRAKLATGSRRVNFLVGPNAGKLDWSETIEVHHHFALVSGRKRSRVLYAGYAISNTLREYRSQVRAASGRA
jgi:CelD/BcsL family acetyltransferase involved in cellulose biosynthesis